MAAELAVAVPAVLVVLLLGVSALGAAAQQVTLQDAAADAARLLGRGEPASAAAAAVARAVDGARVSTQIQDDLACVTARAEVRIGRIVSVPLQASSCALAGGL
ncbi:TadE family type IV pilus minor pilin [Microbacterium sp. CIAB417]|uniref:TadE family type IV pilus minor pilin n=1 Tax=Microbacterium sp. CIAB417 TaxID=2860287 RepID=UPI001FAE6FAB|nr:TadE family type IV pilus minor pilin [Microbacterium sp. CIAB417]